MKYAATLILIVLSITSSFAADEVVLPPEATKLIDAATKDLDQLEMKSIVAKALTLEILVPKLVKAQEAATKAGKLEVSLAIKAKIDEYKKQQADLLARRKSPEAPVVLSGIYAFSFAGTGHMGTLDLKDATAKEVKTNIRGALTQNGNEYVILWSNQTQWTITRTGADLSVSSSDGESKLTKVGK